MSFHVNTQVAVKLVNPNHMADFYFTQDKTAKALELLEQGAYTKAIPKKSYMEVNNDAEDICEELFDLTNNPSRQKQRIEVYGTGRSISVGDIVEVAGVNYLCSSFGWEKVA